MPKAEGRLGHAVAALEVFQLDEGQEHPANRSAIVKPYPSPHLPDNLHTLCVTIATKPKPTSQQLLAAMYNLETGAVEFLA